MRYYSDELKRIYDTEEELVKAELEAKKEKELSEVTRKQLAKKVEEADEKIDRAYEEYEAVKQEIQKIVDETNEKISNMINSAKKNIKDAEDERLIAIKDFNSKYGVYTETYSGDKATKQYNRIVNHFNSIFENVFNPFASI